MGFSAVVLGRIFRDQRAPDECSARVAERLRREELAAGLDDREPRPCVAPVERESREDLSAEVRRPDAVSGEAEAVVDSPAAAEDRHVRGGDVDWPAPGVRHFASARLREEAREALARRSDDAAVELQPVGDASREPHRAASPAEGDPTVACRPHVVHERAAVDDRFAARPAELVEHIRDRLRENDVARRECEREPVAGESRSRRVDGQHGRARAYATQSCLDAAVAMNPRDLRPLMHVDAALEDARAEAERESRRLDGCVEAIQLTTEEERRRTSRPHIVGRHRHDFLRSAEGRGDSDGLVSRPELRLRGCDPEHRRFAEPGVDVVDLAPRADSTHRVLRRTADGERRCVSRLLAQRRRITPERLAEAAVPSARPVSADAGLEHQHVQLGFELAELPGRPETEIPAADDDDVGPGVAFERRTRRDVSCLLQPPAGSRVAHQAGAASRRARAMLQAMTAATATGTSSVQKSGSPPSTAPIETSSAESVPGGVTS